MKIKGTVWSSPKTNIFSAVWCLKTEKKSGRNARLIRAYNEECEFPILENEKTKEIDFRNYQFSIGHASTYNKILNSHNETDKKLSLNYVSVYGTDEAIKTYYSTGILSADNFRSMGRNHLVKVTDYINYLKSINDFQRAAMYENQYLNPNTRDQSFFFDFFRNKSGAEWSIKKFKNKLWVVQLFAENNNPVKHQWYVNIIYSVITPIETMLKYIPKKSVLRMETYKCVAYRIGNLSNGFAVEFHIPKKFSVK